MARRALCFYRRFAAERGSQLDDVALQRQAVSSVVPAKATSTPMSAMETGPPSQALEENLPNPAQRRPPWRREPLRRPSLHAVVSARLSGEYGAAFIEAKSQPGARRDDGGEKPFGILLADKRASVSFFSACCSCTGDEAVKASPPQAMVIKRTGK